ncbi:MAG TPA: hypothetical protein VN616_09495 [Puia sp.]|nr:hypothetical protein [Puia sp.]
MKRIKPYDVPHKGLRHALSQLSLSAGRTDYSDRQQVAELHRLGTRVFSILSIHAEDENSVTLAHLETRCPGAAEHDLDDHERIHSLQDNLERLLAEIYDGSAKGKDLSEAGGEFYIAFSEFHGQYLLHTAEEERVTQPLLWQYFTDEELAGHRKEIMARNPPPTLLTWLRFVIPAQTHAERKNLLAGVKQMAPAAFFAEAMSVIEKVLSVPDFQRLQDDRMPATHAVSSESAGKLSPGPATPCGPEVGQG